MAIAAYADPVIYAEPDTRVSFLRKVAALTFVGLSISAVTGVVSALVVFAIPALQSTMISMVVMLGSYFAAHFVSRRMVYSSNPAVKWTGFLSGTILEGVAMGYLLLAAALMSIAEAGHAFLFIGQAMGLTGMVAFGMMAYLMTGPKNLSIIGSMMSMLFLPMMALMVLTFVFPVGGMFGLGLTALFVVISAAGLLYQLNQVMHKLPGTMYVEGAFEVTMGILVLFWNILVLIMRLQGRD